jgi:hypothetical protein
MRTRGFAAVIIAVLVAGAVVGAVLWHVSASYDALRSLGWYGPQPGRPDHIVWAKHGDAHRLLGPAGTSQAFEFALANDGSHPLTITAVDPPRWRGPGRDPIGRVAWAPYRRPIPGGLINGRPSRSRPFPVSVPPHGTVKIRFTVTKPACPPPNGRDLHAPVAMRVQWHAMVSSHTSVIYPALPDYHVVLCGR